MESGKEKVTDSGIALIIRERKRQIDVEGFDLKHDDEHDDGALFTAGQCYLDLVEYPYDEGVPENWPWDEDCWKPTDKVTCLIKAGALFQAEMERLKRLRDKIARMIDEEGGNL